MTIRRLDHVNFITHDMTATINFYQNIIGLELGHNWTGDDENFAYLYIPGDKHPIIHVMHANMPGRPNFQLLATLAKDNAGQFSTGAIDHVCLSVADKDYDKTVKHFDEHNIEFQSHCHQELPLKQIWLLDPNGIRVELNFTP